MADVITSPYERARQHLDGPKEQAMRLFDATHPQKGVVLYVEDLPKDNINAASLIFSGLLYKGSWLPSSNILTTGAAKGPSDFDTNLTTMFYAGTPDHIAAVNEEAYIRKRPFAILFDLINEDLFRELTPDQRSQYAALSFLKSMKEVNPYMVPAIYTRSPFKARQDLGPYAYILSGIEVLNKTNLVQIDQVRYTLQNNLALSEELIKADQAEEGEGSLES